MSGSRENNSILIIEDDSQLGSNMALILQMEGFEVRVAADGVAGLTMIRKKRPDLILCDILMPRMDGYAFHEAVHSLPHLNSIPFFLSPRSMSPTRSVRVCLPEPMITSPSLFPQRTSS